MWESFPHRYLEETVLTVFFWIGLWGSVSLLLEHFVPLWTAKLVVYLGLGISSFCLLVAREHISNTK